MKLVCLFQVCGSGGRFGAFFFTPGFTEIGVEAVGLFNVFTACVLKL